MGFLSPLFLLAGLAVAVPLLLHLFQRQDRRRIPFPALRYLQRTAREHARSIRFRQFLLLALRVSVVLLLVLAGARLHLRGEGGAHDPTALAIVLDNSPSSGLVHEDVRTLDRLKALALQSLDQAGEDDRIWVIRAGSPGDVSPPGGVAEARVRVEGTEVEGGTARLGETLERAASLVQGAGLPRGEIHLLSDLQASAFPGGGPLLIPAGVPVIAYRPGDDPPPNLGVTDVVVGGGLAPLAGQRTEIVARVSGTGTEPVAVRLVVDDRVVGAGEAPPGGVAILDAGPFPGGWIHGHVEIDPDALRADDRRSFAFHVRPPPRVTLAGPLSPFARQAVDVLASGGRVVVTEETTAAQVWLAQDGAGVESRPPGVPSVILPPADPTLLPALNRRLADAGISWRFEPGPEGEARPGPHTLPVSLGDLRIRRSYRLVPPMEVGPGDAVLLSLAGGEPWLVASDGERGPVLLLGSPLDPDATTLPVSAAMLPFMEWALVRWAARETAPPVLHPGDALPLPPDADRILEPDGTERPRVGSQTALATRMTGIHRIFRGDSMLAAVPSNLDPGETELQRLSTAALRERIGPGLDVARDAGGWRRSIFPAGRGPEAWRPLLLLALLLLVVESRIAATGRRRKEVIEMEGAPVLSR
jgi:hypothetical protein